MKKLIALIAACLMCIAVLPVAAENDVFVLKQSDYMRSLGYEDVVLDHVPQRVACMSSYPFQTLYELGVNFVAVAKTSTFVYPEEIQPLVMPGVISNEFDLEAIVALEPDLVLIPDSSMNTHGATLIELGIPVYAVTTKEPDMSVYDVVKMQTELYINAFAKDEDAIAAADGIRARFTALENKIAEAKQRYEGKTFFGATCVSNTDFYLQGQTSTISSMMQMLGFLNVYDEAMGATSAPASLEAFSDVESDLFLFTTQLADVESAKELCDAAIAANQEVWNTVPAVSRGDIIYLPARYVVTAGLNVIDNIDALIQMLDVFYAE